MIEEMEVLSSCLVNSTIVRKKNKIKCTSASQKKSILPVKTLAVL